MACGLDSQARLLRLVGARRRAVPSDGRLPAAVRRQARSSRPAVPGMLALVGLDPGSVGLFPGHPLILWLSVLVPLFLEPKVAAVFLVTAGSAHTWRRAPAWVPASYLVICCIMTVSYDLDVMVTTLLKGLS